MEKEVILIFHYQLNFFGLPYDYRRKVLNEEFFILLYHYKGSLTYHDIWNLSTNERRWFIDRLNKQYKLEEDEIETIKKKK